MTGVDDVRITAKPDQTLVPLPEGASYLGFIFARGATSADAEQALRDAHACLRFDIDPEVPMVQILPWLMLAIRSRRNHPSATRAAER